MNKFIDCKEELPVPHPKRKKGNAPYYDIQTKKYGKMRAMYLISKKGKCNWYLNYIAKIIVPVTGWLKED